MVIGTLTLTLKIGSPQPGDLVRILVAASGEADNQGLARSQSVCFLEGLGQGVARFQGRQYALAASSRVVGVESLGVGDILVTDAPWSFQ